jgi:hypothetical protein
MGHETRVHRLADARSVGDYDLIGLVVGDDQQNVGPFAQRKQRLATAARRQRQRDARGPCCHLAARRFNAGRHHPGGQGQADPTGIIGAHVGDRQPLLDGHGHIR